MNVSWPVRAGAAALAVVCSGAFAAPASAAGKPAPGTASVAGTTVRFYAGSWASNAVVVTRSGTTVTFDDRYRIKPGKGCKAVKRDRTKVRCTVKKGPKRLSVRLHDRNDSVVNDAGLPMYAEGGSGNDRLVGGSRNDRLFGMTGADRLYGRGGDDRLDADSGNDLLSGGDGVDVLSGWSGNDVLYGGNGNDQMEGLDGDDKLYGGAGADSVSGGRGRDHLDGGPGNDGLVGDQTGSAYADVLLGGSGDDTVTYVDRTAPLTVDNDGARGDDGQAGEHDSVGADVEAILGGRGNDRLTGNTGPDYLSGQGGNDVLNGGGGDDHLYGDEGSDVLYGGAGDDVLDGWESRAAADTLNGGPNGLGGDDCRDYGADVSVDCEL